jgi:hypothetical protein
MSVMPLFTYHSLRHNGHGVITVFQYLQQFSCPTKQGSTRVHCWGGFVLGELRRLATSGATFQPLRISAQVNTDQTSSRTGASSSCGTIPSCKTCDEGADKGADSHDTGEGPERKVELRNGGVLAPPAPHPQQLLPGLQKDSRM